MWKQEADLDLPPGEFWLAAAKMQEQLQDAWDEKWSETDYKLNVWGLLFKALCAKRSLLKSGAEYAINSSYFLSDCSHGRVVFNLKTLPHEEDIAQILDPLNADECRRAKEAGEV